MKRKTAFVVLSCACLTFLLGCRGSGPVKEETAPARPQAVVMFEGVEPEDEIILKDLLRVDGVLIHGEQYIVAINGQVCNVGENLKLTTKNRTYNLEILAISKDRVLVRAVEK